MGIGRASGENRAVQAAQQAIESPLLEVSIDGARGVLFNVIGGKDLSMHEINSAAELITSAADPEANIIFGATINPDLEDEVIITVVATGFDASYFSNRKEADRKSKLSTTQNASSPSTKYQDNDMSDIDTSLDEDKSEEDEFSKDHPIANIWTLDEDHEEDNDKTNSVENRDSDDKADDDDQDEDHAGPNIIDEEEVEKPSFLRRLSKRHHKEEDDQDQEDKQ